MECFDGFASVLLGGVGTKNVDLERGAFSYYASSF